MYTTKRTGTLASILSFKEKVTLKSQNFRGQSILQDNTLGKQKGAQKSADANDKYLRS